MNTVDLRPHVSCSLEGNEEDVKREGWEIQGNRRKQGGDRETIVSVFARLCNSPCSALVLSSLGSDAMLNEFGLAGQFSPEQTADGLKRKHLEQGKTVLSVSLL